MKLCVWTILVLAGYFFPALFIIYTVLMISHRLYWCSFTHQCLLFWSHFLALSWLQPWSSGLHHLWPQTCAPPTTRLFSTWPSEIFWKHKSDLCHNAAHTHRCSQWLSCGLKGRPCATWLCLVPCLIPSPSPFPSVCSNTLAIILSCLEHIVLATCCFFYLECSPLRPPHSPFSLSSGFYSGRPSLTPDEKIYPTLHCFLVLYYWNCFCDHHISQSVRTQTSWGQGHYLSISQ